ncbi:hypothetical protein IGI04_003011 [Brassica rapa subsp. trilocularis]|uniref:Uncharacterized protein n=1 Tax=Brassica rapa subsp. trilocularis TaxID=1813537 RepID=A0ABQ7NX55_BRACM|nr:hypothetical protein IGI04_003011 [Brassica rapa subsp. trilocularis]
MQGFSNKYLDLQSRSPYISRSLTKIGQASTNQVSMVVATKPCSLLFDLYPRIHMKRALKIAATKSRSNYFCWNPYEASLNGCSHQGRNRERKGDKSTQGFTFQTCLKNPIPCIPNPKTSSSVRFSVGG